MGDVLAQVLLYGLYALGVAAVGGLIGGYVIWDERGVVKLSAHVKYWRVGRRTYTGYAGQWDDRGYRVTTDNRGNEVYVLPPWGVWAYPVKRRTWLGAKLVVFRRGDAVVFATRGGREVRPPRWYKSHPVRASDLPAQADEDAVVA